MECLICGDLMVIDDAIEYLFELPPGSRALRRLASYIAARTERGEGEPSVWVCHLCYGVWMPAPGIGRLSGSAG